MSYCELCDNELMTQKEIAMCECLTCQEMEDREDHFVECSLVEAFFS